ncbi:MAG: 30S ribosomal protein S20 [bacterium]|nr:30S ribosomal protein S20 [bacterium]
MANHVSAEKRHKQSLKRKEQNSLAKATFRTFIKKTLAAVKASDSTSANTFARKAESLLDKAAIHGVIHKKTAQRTISRLQKRVNSISA